MMIFFRFSDCPLRIGCLKRLSEMGEDKRDYSMWGPHDVSSEMNGQFGMLRGSTHSDWDKRGTILQMTFSVWMLCMKIVIFLLIFYWNLFLRAQLIVKPITSIHVSLRLSELTHWGQNKNFILQTTFSNAFCWMQCFIFWYKFNGFFFLMVQLTKGNH